MRLFDNSNIVFVHIPKTGGQSVVSSFGMEHRSSDHTINSEVDKSLLGDDYIRFCVVRDPLKRFVSAYRYSVYMTPKNPDMPVRKFIKERNLVSDVNAFVEAIRDENFQIKKAFHFRPQQYYISKTKPQIMLRLENLERDLEIIRAIVPANYIGLQHMNSSDQRPEAASINTELSDKHIEYIASLYRPDYRLLGYSSQVKKH